MKKTAFLLTVTALVLGAASARATGPAQGPFRCGKGFVGTQLGILEVIGLTADQRLICFNSVVPTLSRTIGNVSGLSGDTSLVGIDFRPATGELYGLGNAGGVYTLDLGNGAASFRAQLNVALDEGSFGIDFNPTVDRLRVIGSTGQNLRVNVDTGATTEDTDLLYMTTATGVTGAAYTNNDSVGDTATTLFDIDSLMDQVAIQAPPNAGQLSATGKLIVDTSDAVGFDIYSVLRAGRAISNSAFASLTTDGKARFYRVDLLTGRASLNGTFSSRNQVVDIALPPSQ